MLKIRLVIILTIICVIVVGVCLWFILSNTPSPASNYTTQTMNSVTTTTTPSSTSLPNFSHIAVIMMENHSENDLLGNPAAPYINQLSKTYAYSANYFGVSHPSLPNYLALTSGSTFNLTTDCTNCYQDSKNIADEIEGANKTFSAFMESMPGDCYIGDSNPYAQKHDPFIYYNDIRTNSTRCMKDVVPLTSLYTDISTNNIPDFSFITPNLCDDMHDCSISAGDKWLSTFVPKLIDSPAFKNSGVIFITWDEGESSVNGGGSVLTLVISPLGKTGYISTKLENHYSLLRTIEDAWSLGYLGESANAKSMNEFFY